MRIIKRLFRILIGVLIFLIATLAIYNHLALKSEVGKIIPNGQMIDFGDYSVHVYSEEVNTSAPTLVFLSGSATVAPVYDFKPFYSLFKDEYAIAVVEKAGYGYSDIVELNRDVDTMVNEVRNVLILAKIKAPYILVPHSMSGLDAIYWAQNYPDEVAGIVGLDMAVPSSYDDFDINKVNQMIYLGGTAAKLGLLRIPGIYPLNETNLTEEERQQQKLLMYRNAVNLDYVLEGKSVFKNAQIVKAGRTISCPIIMFCSNGKEIGDFWIATQEEYTKENNAKLIAFDCGHYIHYYKSKEMAIITKTFIEELSFAQ